MPIATSESELHERAQTLLIKLQLVRRQKRELVQREQALALELTRLDTELRPAGGSLPPYAAK